MTFSKLMFCSAAVAAALFMTPDMHAQATAAAPAKTAKPAAKAAPTDAEIADATTKGLVWTNANTKVYHKAGATYYGKTKKGAFMTEADAQKAGYKEAQEPVAKGAKKAKATTTTK
jgi:hypothetical protein